LAGETQRCRGNRATLFDEIVSRRPSARAGGVLTKSVLATTVVLMEQVVDA
jgi:hypothetical protein